MCACICITCWARAEERLSFDVQPSLATELGYVDADKPRRAVEAFMRAYFLVAKDVGDLTRIFMRRAGRTAQEDPALAAHHPAGLFEGRAARKMISMSRMAG